MTEGGFCRLICVNDNECIEMCRKWFEVFEKCGEYCADYYGDREYVNVNSLLKCIKECMDRGW